MKKRTQYLRADVPYGPLVTQAVSKRARAESAQNCFLSFLLSTVTARAVLLLFKVIEINFLDASSTQSGHAPRLGRPSRRPEDSVREDPLVARVLPD
jgi:hypothetical protein